MAFATAVGMAEGASLFCQALATRGWGAGACMVTGLIVAVLHFREHFESLVEGWQVVEVVKVGYTVDY